MNQSKERYPEEGPTLFALEILEQGWLAGCRADEDLCSHGRIDLTIGGKAITDSSKKFGVSETALALLLTLASDHNPQRPVADRMIFHGCGAILMMGCPIGVDFSVSHEGETVKIFDVARYDTTSDTPTWTYPGLEVAFPARAYQRVVLEFARKAREPFQGIAKKTDGYDVRMYREFWEEFDALAAQFGGE